ncbi:glycerophosphodiester phosphodiesterase [Nonomuraea pusilla]|uniref:Glycerophosphoryl diester phosphodiesterase n=1 Tax=Nonomuraea pusilla TaxID=46177 RepID=A0A1H7Z353_9ACTN|nr:glycerophosphodiester phosphodiesterase family protein [Nonomuraea pusilla]SEM51909.1 glycerophosphoryl diester phosphodiesterase [Nonomuraea pusilla]
MIRRLGLMLVTAATVIAGPATTALSDTVTAVAHRGASAYAPENTVAAVELAAAQGADMVEVDVQETRDHQLVLMHDTTLARTTDVESVHPGLSPWRVADLTLAQIRRLDAGSWFGRQYAGQRVPTLAEVLDVAGDAGVGLLVELKDPRLHPGVEERLAAELRRDPAWLRDGRLVVQSFDWASMQTFHRLLPGVPVGLLGRAPTSRLAELARYADQVNPPYETLSAEYVKLVHQAGLRVFAWTVDSPDAMRRMIAYGVDGVITNRPRVLREVLSG